MAFRTIRQRGLLGSLHGVPIALVGVGITAWSLGGASATDRGSGISAMTSKTQFAIQQAVDAADPVIEEPIRPLFPDNGTPASTGVAQCGVSDFTLVLLPAMMLLAGVVLLPGIPLHGRP